MNDKEIQSQPEQEPEGWVSRNRLHAILKRLVQPAAAIREPGARRQAQVMSSLSLVLMLFYTNLKWFPPGRLSDWANRVILSEEFRNYTGLITLDSLLNLRFDIFLDAARHLVLPVVTLSYLLWAMLLRVMRSSMLEALRQNYITTARAKGVTKWAVINRHALPNALMPVVTISGTMVAGLLSGAIVTETVFNYPGIGSAAAEAALHLDVITVLAFTLLTGFILVMVNLAVDILYVFIDPRVRLD